MNAPALTREEGLGLALAALGHVALVWVLVTACVWGVWRVLLVVALL